jgi:formamidopyrimidine-DNA glycosylase
MPELPEVEILVRHLRPLLCGKIIRRAEVRRPRIVRPNSPEEIQKAVSGAKFKTLSRRGKYLLFELDPPHRHPRPHESKTGTRRTLSPLILLGHLGMTGRMFLAPKNEPLPRHAAIVFDLGKYNFVFEDTRYFGRMNLDLTPIKRLGPEPLDKNFSPEILAAGLKRSRQAIKVKLLDQSLEHFK